MVAEAEAAGVGANAVICSRLFALYAAEGQVRSALTLYYSRARGPRFGCG